MPGDKNEIEKLIDTMIESGDELVDNLKTILPNSMSESMVMFHESNVENLKKIKEFLNRWIKPLIRIIHVMSFLIVIFFIVTVTRIISIM